MSTAPSQNSSSDQAKPWLKFYTEGTAPTLDYGETTLVSIFRDAVRKYGKRDAMWFLGTQITYSEFGELVDKAAAVLKENGVKRGDRVAVVLPNCPANLVAFYAIVSLGATAVYHNPLYTAHELEGPFADHGAKVAVFWDNTADIAQHLVDTTPLEKVFTVNITKSMPLLQRVALSLPVPALRKAKAKLTGGPTQFEDWDAAVDAMAPGLGRRAIQDALPMVQPECPALILYTSGTTGSPKGAVLSHRNICANLIQGKAWVPGLGEQADPERMLAALPMFHAYGMTMNGALAPLIGGELLLLPAPEPSLLKQVIKKKKPTWVPGVPALYQAIVKLAEEKNLDLSTMRNSFSGASALPVATVENWEKLTHGRLVEGYGLTETSPIVLGNPMSADRRPGYVGVPFPDTEARVVDQDDPTKVLDYGEEGELVVRGPQVFGGYLHQEQLNEKIFADGWFRTGDMAVMEADGFVKIVSRLKEMIVTGGFNVYPAEVEEALLEHPEVKEAAVVGLLKEDGSERVVAAVTLAEATEGEEHEPRRVGEKLHDSLRQHCKKVLTGYKVPREFFHVATLPADQMGKVRRTEMRAILEELERR